MNTKTRIKQFILDEILAEANSPLDDFADDEILTDSGILDSLGMLKLVAFLDDELGTNIMTQSFKLADFATLDKICAMLATDDSVRQDSNEVSTPAPLADVDSSDGDYVKKRDAAVAASSTLNREFGLEGKVVLVTGSSRGLGAAMIRFFAEQGSKVVVNYNSNKNAATTVADEIASQGGKAMVVQANVGDPGQVAQMFRSIEASFGCVDVLVNNAIRDYSAEDFVSLDWPDVQDAIDVIVRGAFNCCKAAIPGMLKAGSGKIVNIGSLATDNPAPNTFKYVLTKSALVGLTRSLAVDYAAQNIQVNMVSPGLVETDLVAHIPKAFIDKIGSETPMRRNASANDVVQAVAFLSSNQSNFVTGQKIMVTGGQAPFL